MSGSGQDRLFADFTEGSDGLWQKVELHLVPADEPAALRLTFDDGRVQEWPLVFLRAAGGPDSDTELMVTREGTEPAWLMLRGGGVVAELRRLAPGLGGGAAAGPVPDWQQVRGLAPPGDAVPDNRLFAQFANGEDARWQRVELHLEPAGQPTALRLTFDDGLQLHWPLDRLRRLPDLAGSPREVVLKLDGDGLERLHMKGEGVVAEIAALAPRLTDRPPAHNLGRLAKWSVAAVASVALIVFVLVPVMANQLAVFLPPEGEKALGDATFEQIRNALDEDGFGGVSLCEDPDGLAAMEKILARLDPSADLPYDIEYSVLDHDLVNAFALPGGRVVFFRGLIDAAANADEIAAVLAHEIGHVVNRDPTRDALRSAGSIGVLGLLFGDFAGGTVVLFLTNQLINANYSQSAEAGADDYAHDLMARAGLSPAALGTFFERLRAEYGDAEGFVAHFASHPQMVSRIAAAQAAAEGVELTEPLLTEAEWTALKSVCGTPTWVDESDAETETPAVDDSDDPKPGGRRRVGG